MDFEELLLPATEGRAKSGENDLDLRPKGVQAERR